MKRVSLLVSFCLCFIISQAQLRVAIVGGGHQSRVLEENNLPGWDSISKNYSGRTGIHIGFLADMRLSEASNFYFQPGVSFFTKGRKYKSPPADTAVIIKVPLQPDSVFNTSYFQERKNFINYIDIPLNLVYKLKLGKKASFMIGAGPYVSFHFNGFYKTEDIIVNNSLTTVEDNSDLPIGKGAGKFSIFNYGVNGLAGFEFGRLFLTANYSRGLNDFYEPSEYTASSFKDEVVGASIGIFLGKPVNPTPKDSDGDGTPDKTDKCPDIAGPLALLGCPDTDNDGITDNNDKCPGEAGAADNNGCPYPDSDKDGLVDKIDQCPSIPGPKDNNGCPYPDTDKDGIYDNVDKCPQLPGVARYEGCPVPDTDGDGINDEDDKCPGVKGVKENNGCPGEIKKEIVEKVAYAAKRIQFRVNSADLAQGSFKVLDEVASILKENTDIRVSIEGHTSSEGPYDMNVRLSEKRANTVKAYLVSRGIDPERLSAKGFGPDKPLNPGNDAAAKAENRRVELRLNNQ